MVRCAAQEPSRGGRGHEYVPQRRQHGEAFAFRLFLGVALTLLAAGAVSYSLIGQRMRADLLDQGERDLAAQIDRFESAASKARSGEARNAIREFAKELRAREDVSSVAVLDERGRRLTGRVDVAEAGPRINGPGRTEAMIRSDATGRHFHFRFHVRSGPHIYTVAVERDATGLDDFLTAVRESMFVMAIPAILFSLGLFWLLAGRTLHRRHRYALQRATRDGLTDLGNHRAFQDELRRAAAVAERTGADFALAVFDIDDFKFLNDGRGHQHGDEVLRTVAKILGKGRAQDRAFRTGGDEFAMILAATSEYQAITAASRLRQSMCDSGVAVSAGVSATRDGMRIPAVLREEADAALYEAKRRRSDAPLPFSDISEHATILTPQKAHAVRVLINDRALDVAVQPIWDLESGHLVGLEGLARIHSDYGLSGPAEAFDIAEQIGRIADLDRLCVAKVLERAPQLPPGARLFVNVHPASLDGEGTGGGWLLEAVRKAKVRPDKVVVEVTERSGARLPAVVRSVQRLRELGFLVALDDVGAGNSGLEMMRSVPVDYVKVDRSVVQRAQSDVNARAVLYAVVAFASETGTYVIAEGIEDAEGLAFVRGVRAPAGPGVRGGQGFGLGRPAASVAEAIGGDPAARRPIIRAVA